MARAQNDVLPTWTSVTDTEEMENWLFRQNKAHHQQVHQDRSFPTISPFTDLVGEHGTSNLVDSILEGTINLDKYEFPAHIKDWISLIKREEADNKLSPIPSFIEPNEFTRAFKITDEMTSSSPFGTHYTMWKAIAEKEDFCEYLAIMMSLPFQYGFTNKRWENAIEVMLEKKPNMRKIHLMRIIALVEADFNTALKIMYARKLMWNAEQSGISTDQWGGRPNRSAPDCATRKLVYWEYGRYMKIPLASFFGDLASCFDRMKTSLSSIVAMRKGMPKSACLS